MENFSQVVVWPGTVVPKNEIADFEAFLLAEIGTRVKFIETVITKPDKGETSDSSGGRADVLFYVHTEDIAKFAIPRFAFGMRWIEDVLNNEESDYSIYPDYVKAYRTW